MLVIEDDEGAMDFRRFIMRTLNISLQLLRLIPLRAIHSTTCMIIREALKINVRLCPLLSSLNKLVAFIKSNEMQFYFTSPEIWWAVKQFIILRFSFKVQWLSRVWEREGKALNWNFFLNELLWRNVELSLKIVSWLFSWMLNF